MSNDLSDFGLTLNQAHVEIEQRAADLAAVYEVTAEEASRWIIDTLTAERPPINQIYVGGRIPRWKRLIPGWRRRWQRQILNQLAEGA